MAIEVEGLTKEFSQQVRKPGLAGALRGLFSSETLSTRAVDSVSFSVCEGESLAFIGPNGAGKSTTIKMLTGILHPTSGSALVSGLVPWRDGTRLAGKIGCVFGQRSQLWYHLPPRDSFEVLSAIFGIPGPEAVRRTAELAELFDLGDFMDTPVRKLSLGQRMRCEIAACLIHRPRILFLDEPTIGLDVVAKRAIRDFILNLNSQEGTTIFLTSHDTSDIEKLCRRVMVVNRGIVVLDLPVKELRRRYLMRKVVGVRFDCEPGEVPSGPGLTLLKRKGPGLKFEVDTSVMDIGRALALVSEAGSIADITVADPPLEGIIASIYEDDDPRPVPGNGESDGMLPGAEPPAKSPRGYDSEETAAP